MFLKANYFSENNVVKTFSLFLNQFERGQLNRGGNDLTSAFVGCIVPLHIFIINNAVVEEGVIF
jgi:hypothetical protein